MASPMALHHRHTDPQFELKYEFMDLITLCCYRGLIGHVLVKLGCRSRARSINRHAQSGV